MRIRELEQENAELQAMYDTVRPPKHLGKVEAGTDSDRVEIGAIKLKAENEQLEEENQRLRTYENRWLLKLALSEAHEEGLRLKQSDPSDRDAEKWMERTYAMLKDALPFYANLLDIRLKRTIQRNPESPLGFDVDDDQVMDIALNYIESIARSLDTRDWPTIRPNFNGRAWVSER